MHASVASRIAVLLALIALALPAAAAPPDTSRVARVVMPAADGGYATWDWIRSRATRLRLAGAGLVMSTPRGDVVAERTR